MLNNGQIDDFVTDSRAAVHLVEAWVKEGAEGDVLDGELAISIVLNPAAEGAIVLLCLYHSVRIKFLSLISRFKYNRVSHLSVLETGKKDLLSCLIINFIHQPLKFP